MKRVSNTMWLLVVMIALAVAVAPSSRAGLGDKLKKKAEDKAGKTADSAINKADTETTKKAEGEKSEEAGDKGDAPAAAKGSGEVASVSTKFDFTPGDKLLFFDDFTQDELGEFPVHWKLKQGTWEVAEMSGQRWLRSTAIDSHIAMKAPSMPELPEFWTLEFDWYCPSNSGNVLNVYGQKGDAKVWYVIFPYSGTNLYAESGKVNSNTPFDDAKVWGKVHHVMFMARGQALKVYVDQQRLANIPEIDATSGSPDNIDIQLWSDKQPMITNVRFAEGPKPMKDPFAEGTLVTYGIYFDSGSDVVKPESAPVLRQIATYLTANPAVKVNITGHTDNQGTPSSNLDLSKRRSASVAKVLADQFKLGADRFQTDGMGDTKSIAKNDTSEGRATNRRVEFTKI
jgi:OOP family OmpA-OmpF porin